MRGPYEIHIHVEGEDPLVFEDPDEVINDPIVNRLVPKFYANGPDYTLVGTERAACFYTSQLLQPGEAAEVELIGTASNGARKVRVAARQHYVSRLTENLVMMSLGCKFGAQGFHI